MSEQIRFEDYVNLSTLLEENKYVIDIGAQDGPGPVYELFTKKNFSGLCIEGNSDSYGRLCNNLPQPNVNKHLEFIHPYNALQIFEKNKVPKEPFVLKIDIDGFDLIILRTLLPKYRPMFVVAEINEKIPPPIYFETLYTPLYQWGTNHFFGFSLQTAYDVLPQYGYKIVSLIGGNNVFCVRSDLIKPQTMLPTPTELYERDYLNNPAIFSGFPWNADVNHWTKMQPNEAIDDMIDYFTTTRIQRDQNIGRPVSRDAFICRISENTSPSIPTTPPIQPTQMNMPNNPRR